MDDTARRIAELSKSKRALFELLRKERKPETRSPIGAAPGRPHANIFPMSYAQERLWFLDQLQPGTPLYNVPFSIRLSGPLNRAALAQSIQQIIRRHEILRTTFASSNGTAVQIIHPFADDARPLATVDLRPLPSAEREALTKQLIVEEGQNPFDLSQGPLLRAALLWIDEDEYVLLLTMHHIITDGWSLGIFMRELAELYAAFSKNNASRLRELPIQYADFAVWQRQWLQGGVLDAQLSYWKKQLGGELSPLEIMGDRARPPAQTFRGSFKPIELTGPLSAALKRLSREQNATLFMTLLAAFKTLLYRYTGQTDLLVGSPIANRNQVETGDLMGFFVNTLVLRTDLSADPPFNELLRQVRGVTLGAYAHQDMPFERLVEELRPERDLSRTPIFQVMFALQNAPLPPLQLEGMQLSYVGFDHQMSRFDLSLSIEERPAGLAGFLEYNADLFDGETIERMVAHFNVLLNGIAAHPQQRLSDLPLLSGAEERQLLNEWNQTQIDYRVNLCLHQEFAAQAERTPDAIAASFEDECLTYRELNRRANQLAHYLQELGVGPERLVAIHLEHSLEMVVGLLGILKAGAAYVPLDLHAPKERLDFVLQDTAAAALLTRQGRVAGLPSGALPVICLDADWHEISRRDTRNPTSGVTVDNLAYVIYTSGSTGQPKGTMIEHRSVLNFISWVNNMLASEGVSCVPAITQLIFDASLRQVFAPLLRGDDVWLLGSDLVTAPERLAQAISKRRNVALNCVPSLWQALLASINSEQAAALRKSVRTLLLGGERLNEELFEATSRAMSNPVVWNLYGPTETTVNAAAARVERGQPITIGRPIANTLVYVLDKHLRPVPVGVPGELYIGGSGVARGYLNRSDVTAEKFIGNPFSELPGQRLYKSGDLVRYLPDGHIEFLGRLDDQVKVHGFRIELGEVEAALRQYPTVRQAVVLAQNDSRGRRSLAAYIVAEEEQGLIEGLRRLLTEKLPRYMIPSSFTILDAMPLTSTGKVNRRLLPSLQDAAGDSPTPYQPPRTPVEEKVVAIWADVLAGERIGVHDNFFELGGHSLLAITLFSQLREAFGVDLLMRDLFESPTVAGLAEVIERAKKVADQINEPALVPLPRQAYRVE